MQRLGDDWTEGQQALWDGFSKDFQTHFEQWTMLSAVALADALALDRAGHLLEIGCGAGGAAALLSERLPGHGRWTALDLSDEMVALAQQALGERATVVQGSAEALPFEDGTFDRVFSNLCLMLVADPVAALAEAHRVAAPRARVGWTVWGRPQHSPMMTLVGQACETLDIDVPATERPNFHLGEWGVLPEAVRDAGFVEVQGKYAPMAMRVSDGREFAQEMLYTGPRRQAWMASLGAETEAALVAEVARQADGFLRSRQPLSLDVLHVVATR